MSTAADALARLVEGIDRERLGAYGVVVRVGADEVAHRGPDPGNPDPAVMRLVYADRALTDEERDATMR